MEKVPPAHEQEASLKLVEAVHQVGLIHGIAGLKVVVRPGAGWSCAQIDEGLVITADPQQLLKQWSATGYGDAKPPSTDLQPAEEHILHTIAHELGHAIDFLDQKYPQPPPRSNEDGFFNNVIDDAVIDTRNNAVPLLQKTARGLYDEVLFPRDDLTNLPKHIQLMYALLCGAALGEYTKTTVPEVNEAIQLIVRHSQSDKTFDIMTVLADPRTTLAERRLIAHQFIKLHFDNLREMDKQEPNNQQPGGDDQVFEAIYEQYEQAMHGHQSNDETKNESSSGIAQGGAKSPSRPDNGLAMQIAKTLEHVRPQSISEQSDSNGNGDVRAQVVGDVARKMNLSPGDAKEYVNSLNKWRSTIGQITEVFLRLAVPADTATSPRFRRGASNTGVRLHPSTLPEAKLQLEDGTDRAIWQSVERQAPRPEINFGGLDVYLLVDVSASMNRPNTKARFAADTAMCLIEGLQLARYRTARENQHHEPDVRTQIIAFGSGMQELSPLSHTLSGEQKGATYTNLRQANSYSTQINDALAQVAESASANPERSALVIIISDGDFYDHDRATQTVAGMEPTVHVTQLVIESVDAKKFITNHHEAISDPSTLPVKLYKILAKKILDMSS